MAKREPLYPHVPKGKNIGEVAKEVESLIRERGRLHVIDITKMATAAHVSPTQVEQRLSEDVTLDRDTGYYTLVTTPVYTGSLPLSLWMQLSTDYGPDAANNIVAKVDEVLGAAQHCKLTGPNGFLDHYDDLSGILYGLEERTDKVESELYAFVAEQVAAALRKHCNCQIT